MKNLPNVTVVLIDCVAHALAKEALRDTLRHINPMAVHVYSDLTIAPGADHFRVSVNSMRDYERVLWYEVPKNVLTSHFLVIQYDSWVLNADCWDDGWLTKDYIGAPWWYSVRNVGNGGFSLRSKQLAEWIADRPAAFPLGSHNEDELLCRYYNRRLRSDLFYWGTDDEARKFSFERVAPPGPTFGFHGIFNWDKVMGADALAYRKSLANDYVKSRSEWRELTEGVKLWRA